MAHVSLITLGVDDLDRATRFYTAMGWRRSHASVDGTIEMAAEPAEWGGYSGYFADPDGHLWEVAHNPYFRLLEDGKIVLPDEE